MTATEAAVKASTAACESLRKETSANTTACQELKAGLEGTINAVK